jgi:exo-beta-1,3-glucanase (GH17 family)
MQENKTIFNRTYLTKMIRLIEIKKLRTFSFLLSLIILLVNGCESNENRNSKEDSIITSRSMKTIEQNLNSKIYPEKESPFVIRKFDPNLDGRWIGNAVSYGPYREGQAPGVKGPNEAEILEDLKIVEKHWNLIRVYGSDNDTENVLKVISQNNLPIKVMLGVWLENETKKPQRKIENIEQVLKAIELGNRHKDIIAAISVGNESQVFWSAHRMEMKNLIRYLRFVRNNTDVPVTTADDYNFWNKPESKQVADEVDFIVTHIYPLWNGKTLANSIKWMDDVFRNQIKKSYSDKTIVLGEIGWATNYNPEKKGDGEQGSLIKAEVSIAAQQKFLIMLNDWIETNRVTTFLFEAFDELWKGGGESTGPNEIEKHWGVFYENRKPKESFTNFIKYKDQKLKLNK